jgi:hypothetical protein
MVESVGMEKIERVYYREGTTVRPPVAGNGGPWSEARRYRLIEEGVVECLWCCGKGERVLMSALQQAWVECRAIQMRLPKLPEPQGELGFDGVGEVADGSP